ncbi:MAG: EboA domain-containing protein [Polyangiaceae bacterium]|nr:EboA domain-containing protein [Polyangiaceae bacterium]NUQ74942.1 EboA domain-containing protein [Polyangiaceae bacterium]
MDESLSERLAAIVSARTVPQSAAWFLNAMTEAGSSDAVRRVPIAFAGAGRRLGRAGVELLDGERDALQNAGMSALPEGWGVDAVGRVALLIRAASHIAEPERSVLVADLYEKGELREQEAVLRALAYLPEPQSYLAVAVGACRSHAQSVFEAIACENPYPAKYFPDLNFAQMVLKAVFTGASVERIAGLDGRITPELVRMAEGYASERRAAGRPVPIDIDRIIAGARRN